MYHLPSTQSVLLVNTNSTQVVSDLARSADSFPTELFFCLQVWLSEADGGLSDNSSRRQSGGFGLNSQATTPGSSSLKQLNNRSPASRESPDGSYTEDQGAELHFKSRSSEFDDDFDDEEPLPSIGTCKSLYPFQGTDFFWMIQ
ncbi:hypothetical protein XENOCAPTIV_026687 [Xenoophorus captivus]|uniref:Uncharacterized protein n=1 Tax=Xenoophorus captivus TaxID=1517983 RepID=A0ABV0QBN2_9TELE